MKKLFSRLFPIFLAIIVFLFVTFLFKNYILFLNLFPTKSKIVPVLFIGDILVGLVIYLKTSIDFALFIGNLMSRNPGTKNRIAIETGTALGNAIGTMLVLSIWTFFKEIPLLLVASIVIAALILFQLAHESLKEYLQKPLSIPFLSRVVLVLIRITGKLAYLIYPLSHLIFPKKNVSQKSVSFFALFIFSITLPFILGLDDFAGYIPLFTIVNVFGFSVGVFLGHLLLNIGLFASPTTTTKIVRLPMIQLFGAFAFIAIALWGFVEAGRVAFSVLQIVR